MGETNVTEKETELINYFSEISKQYECANIWTKNMKQFWLSLSADKVADSENCYKIQVKDWSVCMCVDGGKGHLIMKHFFNMNVYNKILSILILSILKYF